MKSSLTLLVLVVLLLNILAGCAPGANHSKGTANEHDVVAGFWLGLWHGFIAPFVFMASLFKSNLSIYEVHNNGAWYNFGYLFGLACFFGGSGNRSARRKQIPTASARLTRWSQWVDATLGRNPLTRASIAKSRS
jgi:hypothetical protein